MSINVNLQVLPFGQIVLKVDSPVYEVREPLPNHVQETLEYHEPQQTVPFVYEFIYEQQLNNFVVSPSTVL